VRDKASWDWDGFRRDLAASLAALAEDEILILQVNGSGRYVQCLHGPDGQIRAEVVSNAFLGPKDALSDAQVAALRDRGWAPPQQGQSPNFHRDESGATAPERTASLLVGALTGVLDLSSPLDLRLDAFQSRGRRIELPALGLERLERNQAQGKSARS